MRGGGSWPTTRETRGVVFQARSKKPKLSNQSQSQSPALQKLEINSPARIGESGMNHQAVVVWQSGKVAQWHSTLAPLPSDPRFEFLLKEAGNKLRLPHLNIDTFK